MGDTLANELASNSLGLFGVGWFPSSVCLSLHKVLSVAVVHTPILVGEAIVASLALGREGIGVLTKAPALLQGHPITKCLGGYVPERAPCPSTCLQDQPSPHTCWGEENLSNEQKPPAWHSSAFCLFPSLNCSRTVFSLIWHCPGYQYFEPVFWGAGSLPS